LNIKQLNKFSTKFNGKEQEEVTACEPSSLHSYYICMLMSVILYAV